jgi:transposase
VAWLGEVCEDSKLVLKARESSPSDQRDFFDDRPPEWVEINTQTLRVEHIVDFGGPWLGLQLIHLLDLDRFLSEHLPRGKEEVPWDLMAEVLILSRLCHPSSELEIAEDYFERSALADLLGIPKGKINDDRLYRALDRLLPHKEDLQVYLKERVGSLFNLSYDLFLYDITSTYFEGQSERNPLAQRGYSRDKRGDCKQICIALVVTREGFPLGYEVFAGNRTDVTTVEEIIEEMEARYGQADRIWVMDRGMASEENFDFLNENGRRYIVGANRDQLKRYERELLEKDWMSVQEGLEVKKVESPDGKEVYILCRSRQRALKEAAIHERFEKRIEKALTHIAQSASKRRQKAGLIERRIGRILERNSRAAGLFEIQVTQEATGHAKVSWSKREAFREWSALSEGCYLLRSNVTEWTAEDLWRAYIQLTEAEDAFRIHKSDLRVRPIWHQKEERVRAHILVCFLAYVLWKTLEGLCRQAGLGDAPSKVFKELCEIKLVNVVMSTRQGIPIKLRCVSTPTSHQAILLQRLRLKLPSRFPMQECSGNF